MAPSSRLYGRKNFTRLKAIKQILDPHEQPNSTGTRVRFEGLPADQAAVLLTKLPEAQQHDSADTEAPTFATLVQAALQIPGAVLAGYRTDPSDTRERITLTRISLPAAERTKQSLDQLVAHLPDHQQRLRIANDGSAYIDWQTPADPTTNSKGHDE